MGGKTWPSAAGNSSVLRRRKDTCCLNESFGWYVCTKCYCFRSKRANLLRKFIESRNILFYKFFVIEFFLGNNVVWIFVINVDGPPRDRKNTLGAFQSICNHNSLCSMGWRSRALNWCAWAARPTGRTHQHKAVGIVVRTKRVHGSMWRLETAGTGKVMTPRTRGLAPKPQR